MVGKVYSWQDLEVFLLACKPRQKVSILLSSSEDGLRAAKELRQFVLDGIFDASEEVKRDLHVVTALGTWDNRGRLVNISLSNAYDQPDSSVAVAEVLWEGVDAVERDESQ